MDNLQRIIIKSLIVLLCGGLLIWNGFQKHAIKKGTHWEPVEYYEYTTSTPKGVKAEASVRGMVLFGTEQTVQTKGGYAVGGSITSGYYYLAVLQDNSPALIYVNIFEHVGGSFNHLKADTLEEIYEMYNRQPVTIRGVTTHAPDFSSFVAGSALSGINLSTLESYTMLKVDSSLGNVEQVEPDLAKLPAFLELILWVAGGIAGLLLLLNIYFVVKERKEHEGETWICCTCGAENSYFKKVCACGQPKDGPPIHQAEEAEAAARANNWVCSCGREHPAYDMDCACGKTKLDAKKEALAKKKAEEQQ